MLLLHKARNFAASFRNDNAEAESTEQPNGKLKYSVVKFLVRSLRQCLFLISTHIN